MLSLNFTIEADLERKIIFGKIYGIWKEETAHAYLEEYVETAKPLLDDKWARLTNLSNWKSSYPEIIEILGKHMHWCQDNGAVYSVFIIDNPVTRSQLQRMINTGHVSSISKLFRTYEEGDKFLKANGF